MTKIIEVSPGISPFLEGRREASVHLPFLDGIRGLAALYVCIFHLIYEFRLLNQPGILKLLTVFNYGHYSVSIFIVLSGFCLMLPIALSPNKELRGGVRGFLKRRSLRILPPYYAALAFTLILIAIAPGLKIVPSGFAYYAFPAFEPGAIISHLLLIHNLKHNWNFRIDPPLWSVAMEFQIYILFALVLLPIWRRAGSVAAMLAALLLSCLPALLLPGRSNLAWTCPWFIGLFAMGMLAADIAFSPLERARDAFDRIPWGTLSICTITALLLVTIKYRGWFTQHMYAGDMTVGVATAGLILYCLRVNPYSFSRKSLYVVRFLSCSPLVTMGAFSYSLYLIHNPLQAVLHTAMVPFLTTPMYRLYGALAALPLILLISWGFHLLVERPFVKHKQAIPKPEKSATEFLSTWRYPS